MLKSLVNLVLQVAGENSLPQIPRSLPLELGSAMHDGSVKYDLTTLLRTGDANFTGNAVVDGNQLLGPVLGLFQALYYLGKATTHINEEAPTYVQVPSLAPISTSPYLGCYAEPNNGFRALSIMLASYQSGYKACFALAQSQGYRYVGFEAWNAGIQGGQNTGECWGGNDLTNAEVQGLINNCALEATTDGSIMWGGPNCIALYDVLRFTAADSPTSQLSRQPSSQPSMRPSRRPTSQPTRQVCKLFS